MSPNYYFMQNVRTDGKLPLSAYVRDGSITGVEAIPVKDGAGKGVEEKIEGILPLDYVLPAGVYILKIHCKF